MDKYIGKTFGDKKQLLVIEKDYKPATSHNQKYIVLCSICSKDKELYGDGRFSVSGYDLAKGRIPCGCSKSMKRSVEQWRDLITRKCESSGLKFIDFIGWKGQDTKVKVECPIHGRWETATLTSILNGRNCPTCAIVKRAAKKITPEENVVARVKETGVFAEGTVFNKDSPNGRIWSYYCPICSEDEYVQSGNCSGVFKSDRANLIAGKLACRCAYNHKWSQKEREFQIRRDLTELKHDYKFVGWESDQGYSNQSSRAILNCVNHGDYSKSVSSLIDNKHYKCPACVGRDADPNRRSHFYVLDVSGMCHDFVGYGITANISSRSTEHSKKLAEFGFKINHMYSFETNWKTAVKLETIVKNTFEIFPQEMIGFKREATYHVNLQGLLCFAENYLTKNPTQF